VPGKHWIQLILPLSLSLLIFAVHIRLESIRLILSGRRRYQSRLFCLRWSDHFDSFLLGFRLLWRNFWLCWCIIAISAITDGVRVKILCVGGESVLFESVGIRIGFWTEFLHLRGLMLDSTAFFVHYLICYLGRFNDSSFRGSIFCHTICLALQFW
jgi:hypothetical protein